MSDMEVDQPVEKGKGKKESGKPRFEVKKVRLVTIFRAIKLFPGSSGLITPSFLVERSSTLGMG